MIKNIYKYIHTFTFTYTKLLTYRKRYIPQIGYLRIHNSRDHLLKFKHEQYTSQLKVMPLCKLHCFTVHFRFLTFYLYQPMHFLYTDTVWRCELDCTVHTAVYQHMLPHNHKGSLTSFQKDLKRFNLSDLNEK